MIYENKFIINMLNMRNTLLFSLALGLAVTTVEAKASKVSNLSNLAAATSYSANRVVQNTVTGTVSDANGPMAGVSVSVVGVPSSTRTDADGKFKITAALGATLRFSSVGYLSQDVKVSGSTVNVLLKEEDNTLDEVVVVGYGQQKKAHLTGAVSSVNADEVFGSRPIPDAARGLQGTVPGLSIQIPSGEVGSDAVMKIRGQIASVNGSSNPLILVDNVEVPSLQYINPSDIETITVLKDAASSSIYGAKAAFGVVLVTTKKGAKTDGVQVNYNTNLSLQSPFTKIDIAGVEGIEYTLDAYENMNGNLSAGGFWRIDRESLERIKEWQSKYGSVVKNNDPIVYNRDWYVKNGEKFGVRLYDPVDAMVKDRTFSNIHNLGLNGKSGNTLYNFNLGYLGQEGLMKPAKHDDYRRYTGKLNLSTKVNDAITLRAGTLFADGTKRYPNSAGGFYSDPWLYLYRWSRLFPIGVTDQGNELRDPYFETKNAHDYVDRGRYLNLNIGSSIEFTKGWDLQVDYTYSSENNSDQSSMPTFTGAEHWYAPVKWVDGKGNQVFVDEEGNVVNTGGDEAYRFPVSTYFGKDRTYFYQSSYAMKKHTFNAFTTYQRSIADFHDFKVMLGTNIVSGEWSSHWSRRGDLINENNPQMNFTIGTETVGGDKNWDSQAGFFGRLNYTFKDKYLLEGNLRYDGTSKFPSHLRWRWYPSVSAGWVISNEQFAKELPVLSFAKLRGSYGVIGDQSVSNNLYIARMGLTKNTWIDGNGNQFYQLGTPNPISQGITWQDIEHLNLGVDLRFFNNKLGLGAEWYQRYTKNMIIAGQTLPDTYGASAPDGNYGNLRTRGWEVFADYSYKFDNGLKLNFNANIADAITMITKSADWNIAWENRKIDNTFTTGKRYGDVYGYVTDRLYQKDDFLYDDNGNFLKTTVYSNGNAREMNMLAGDNPVYQPYFQDGGPTMVISPGDVKFVDVNGDGYITPGASTFGDPGDRVVVGNFTPRYEYGFRLGAEFKNFDFSAFLQGVGARKMWGDGQIAIAGYNPKEGAMPYAIASDYWRSDRTDAFYPRAWDMGKGVGDSPEGYVMRVQSRYMLNMAYMRIKNITLGYSVSESVLQKIRIKNARLYVSLENMFTFDKLRGLPIDPEAISGHSMLRSGGDYNAKRTGVGTPVFKSASMGVQISL